MATDVLVPWNDIPDVALLYIYTNLSNLDRLNLACTCKNWNRLFYSSSLWRERRVKFDAFRPERRAELEKKYIDIFGHSMSKLAIMIGQPTFKTCMTISKAVDSYLNHICRRNDIHLRELDLEHLHFDQNWHFILSRNRLTTALCRLIRKQKCLEHVYVSGARMRIFDGCRMLEALARGFTGRTLTSLFMEDFFEVNVFPFRQPRFVSAISKFYSLQHLHINYRYINSEVLRNFANKSPNTLRTLSMILDGDVRGIEIPSEVWYEFTTKCPHVKLNIYLCTTILRGNDLRSAFVREMPLYECYLTSYSRLDETEQRLGNLLQHLGANYHRTLENFAMFFEQHERVDEDLLYLIGRCRGLKDLCIQCKISSETIIRIMELIHEGRTGLASINLTVPGLTDEDWNRIDDARSRLIPVTMEFFHIGPNEFGSSVGSSTLTADEDDDADPDIVLGVENRAIDIAMNEAPEVEDVEPEEVIIVISDSDDSASEDGDGDEEGFLM